MTRNVTYDFTIDSIVSVSAPIGTDPETLIEYAKKSLIQRVKDNDITLIYETIFDPETGVYDDDWEGYANEQR